MKSLTLIFTFILFSTSLSAQKIKFDDGKVTVDGVEFLKWINPTNLDVSLSGLTTEDEEIFVRWMSYKDPNQISTGNPEGYVRWIELNFLLLDVKCEIMSQTRKDLIRFIITNKLYVDGIFNEENARKLVQKYGTSYSINRPGGNVNIIIKE